MDSTLRARLLDGRNWKAVVYLITASMLQTFPDKQALILQVAFVLSGSIGLFFKDSSTSEIPGVKQNVTQI